METLFYFLVEASTGIILFYVVYWLFLRQETFHKANRWFLLAALALSVVLPVFPVHYAVFIETKNPATVLKALSETFRNAKTVASTPDEMTSEFDILQMLFWIYLTGAVIFLFRLFTQTLVLVHLILKQKIQTKEGVRIVENEKYGLPFSFFNIVFINPKFHNQENLPEILAHEKVHIRENHWFDLLIIELLTVIFWFNPFIWFFERSIKQNHEYLADQAVLSTGLGVGRYKALLVNQLMGMQIVGVTNNLNFALSTKRLKMMTKKKTSRVLGIKFAWALPALALLLFAFAEPEYKVKEPGKTGKEGSAVNSNYQKSITLSGLVLDENNEPLPGASVIIKGSTTGTVSDTDGSFTLQVPEHKTIVISFIGKQTLQENYNDILAGNRKGGTYHRKYMMQDDIILASAAFDDSELPPPPPKPEKVEPASPPPPPAEKGMFYIVEDMPAYPGGPDALSKYIQNETKKYNLKGKAKIGFTVNAKGKVTDINVVDSDTSETGKAASEIIGTLPDWKPGTQRGKPVPVKFLIIVEF